MKKMFLLLFLMGEIAFAQSFTMTCDTLVKNAPPGTMFYFFPQLTNLSGNTIQIRIARRLNQLPNSSWASYICYGSCYNYDVDTVYDDMPYPFSGIDFTIDVQSDPSIPGTATVTVAVVNTANPNDFQQLTFTASTISTDIKDNDVSPKGIELFANYPNPFNPTTTISYCLPEMNGTQPTQLIIYNTLGQKIRSLVNARQTPGLYTIQWDGLNDNRQTVASGVYLYRLTSGAFESTKKMIWDADTLRTYSATSAVAAPPVAPPWPTPSPNGEYYHPRQSIPAG